MYRRERLPLILEFTRNAFHNAPAHGGFLSANVTNIALFLSWHFLWPALQSPSKLPPAPQIVARRIGNEHDNARANNHHSPRHPKQRL
jgi:hypothetical protein